MERKLTPRQLEILKLLADGHSSEDIGKELGNSKNTIDNMRNEMLIRVGVKNVAHLVAWGFRNGQLE